MLFKYEQITEGNFNEWLEKLNDMLNEVEPPTDIDNVTEVDFDSLNMCIQEHDAIYDSLGRVYIDLLKLNRFAKRQYDLTKANAMLSARRNRDEYPAEADRKAFAELDAEKDGDRMEGMISLCDEVHRRRQSIYKRMDNLINIGHNIRAKAKTLSSGGY